MKKFVALTLWLTLLFLSVAYIALAAPVTIISPDGQRTTEVSGRNLAASPAPNGLAYRASPNSTTAQIYSGSCRVLSVNFYHATAGSVCGVYDFDVRYGSPDSVVGYDPTHVYTTGLEFELATAVNTSSISYDAKGAEFTYGIYIVADGGLVSVVYDY